MKKLTLPLTIISVLLFSGFSRNDHVDLELLKLQNRISKLEFTVEENKKAINFLKSNLDGIDASIELSSQDIKLLYERNSFVREWLSKHSSDKSVHNQ